MPDLDLSPTEHDHSAQSASERRDTEERCHERAMPLVDAAASRSATAAGEATVLLGHRGSGDEPVIWRAKIRANPHLMILGQPGMGKTTSLINICLQLEEQGVTPIVFSYHEDISTPSWTACAPRRSPIRVCSPGWTSWMTTGYSMPAVGRRPCWIRSDSP